MKIKLLILLNLIALNYYGFALENNIIRAIQTNQAQEVARILNEGSIDIKFKALAQQMKK